MLKPKSVEAYLKSLPPDHRAAVQTLRETIASAAPEAEEGITYSMPGFLLDGRGLVSYAAFKDHYSFFPMSWTRPRCLPGGARGACHGEGDDPVRLRPAAAQGTREEGGPDTPSRGYRSTTRSRT